MRRATILAIGRLRDGRMRSVCDDYLKRCRKTLQIEEIEVRDTRSLEKHLSPRSLIVVLDERGEMLTSRELASQLKQWMDQSDVPVTFVIGGADGVDRRIRERADFVLSLSSLTFAHRLVRVILAEQLYRAVSILEGSPYHRD